MTKAQFRSWDRRQCAIRDWLGRLVVQCDSVQVGPALIVALGIAHWAANADVVQS